MADRKKKFIQKSVQFAKQHTEMKKLVMLVLFVYLFSFHVFAYVSSGLISLILKVNDAVKNINLSETAFSWISQRFFEVNHKLSRVVATTLAICVVFTSVYTPSLATEPGDVDPASTTQDTTATDPTATDPATTDPATTDPATTDPAATDPATTDPTTTDPATTDPAATNPAATDPATTDPATTDPTTDPSQTTDGTADGTVGGTTDGTTDGDEPEDDSTDPDDEGEGDDGDIDDEDEDEIETYTITYVLLEEDEDASEFKITNPNPKSYTTEEGSLPITLENPTKKFSLEGTDEEDAIDYEFLGWTMIGDEIDSVTVETKNLEIPEGTTGDLKITAHWQAPEEEIIEYSISYEGVDDTNNAEINPDKYYSNSKAITLEDPMRADAANGIKYTFLGWTYDGQEYPEHNTVIKAGTTGDLTFTANWATAIEFENSGWPYGDSTSEYNITLYANMKGEPASVQWQYSNTKYSYGTWTDIPDTSASSWTSTNGTTSSAWTTSDTTYSGKWIRCQAIDKNGDVIASQAVKLVYYSSSSGVFDGLAMHKTGQKSGWYVSNEYVAYTSSLSGCYYNVVGRYTPGNMDCWIGTSYGGYWVINTNTSSSLGPSNSGIEKISYQFGTGNNDHTVYCDVKMNSNGAYFSYNCDTMLGDGTTSGGYSDRAALSAILNSDSTRVQSIQMVGAASKEAATDTTPCFVIGFETNPMAYWIGYYGSRTSWSYNSGSGNENGYSKDGIGALSGYITEVYNTDSGMSVSYNVGYGGSLRFSFAAGTTAAAGASLGSVTASAKTMTLEGLSTDYYYYLVPASLSESERKNISNAVGQTYVASDHETYQAGGENIYVKDAGLKGILPDSTGKIVFEGLMQNTSYIPMAVPKNATDASSATATGDTTTTKNDPTESTDDEGNVKAVEAKWTDSQKGYTNTVYPMKNDTLTLKNLDKNKTYTLADGDGNIVASDITPDSKGTIVFGPESAGGVGGSLTEWVYNLTAKATGNEESDVQPYKKSETVPTDTISGMLTANYAYTYTDGTKNYIGVVNETLDEVAITLTGTTNSNAADATSTTTTKTVKIYTSEDGSTGTATYKFQNIPLYTEDGFKINYSVSTGDLAGFEIDEANTSGYNIALKYEPKTYAINWSVTASGSFIPQGIRVRVLYRSTTASTEAWALIPSMTNGDSSTYVECAGSGTYTGSYIVPRNNPKLNNAAWYAYTIEIAEVNLNGSWYAVGDSALDNISINQSTGTASYSSNNLLTASITETALSKAKTDAIEKLRAYAETAILILGDDAEKVSSVNSILETGITNINNATSVASVTTARTNAESEMASVVKDQVKANLENSYQSAIQTIQAMESDASTDAMAMKLEEMEDSVDSATSISTLQSYIDSFDQYLLTQAKSVANDAAAARMNSTLAEINATDLSDDRKTELSDDAKTRRSEARSTIASATSVEDVYIYNAKLVATEEVIEQAALASLSVNSMTNLTASQKAEYLSEIEEWLNNAEIAIGKGTSTSGITNLVGMRNKNLLTSVRSYAKENDPETTVVSLKNIEVTRLQIQNELNSNAELVKATVNSLSDLRNDEKAAQIEAIETILQNYISEVGNAETAVQLENLRKTGIDALTNQLSAAINEDVKTRAENQMESVDAREDLTDEEKKDETDKINQEKDEADYNSEFAENVDSLILTNKRTQAKRVIEDSRSSVSASIRLLPYLTTEEAAEYTSNLSTYVTDYKMLVDTSLDETSIEENKETYLSLADELLKNAVLKNLQNKAAAAKEEVNNNPDLTNEEKEQKIREIEEDLQNSMDQVNDEDATQEDLDQLIIGPIKDETEEELKEEAEEKKKKIRADEDLTPEEKDDQCAAVDEELNQTLKDLEDATDATTVELVQTKAKARAELETAVETAITTMQNSVNARTDLTAAEKKELIAERKATLNASKESGKSDIDAATTATNVRNQLAKIKSKINVQLDAWNSIDAINQQTNISDEEKEQLITEVEEEQKKSEDQIDTSKSVTATKLNEEKIDKKKELKEQADAEKLLIDSNNDLTDQEKQDLKDAVDERLKEAQEKIDNASSISEVDSIAEEEKEKETTQLKEDLIDALGDNEEAKEKVETYLPTSDDGETPSISDALEKAVEENLKELGDYAKEVMDSMTDLTDEEKEEYQQRIEEELNKAKESDASTALETQNQKNETTSAIEEILKEATENNLNTKAAKERDAVNNDDTIVDDEDYGTNPDAKSAEEKKQEKIQEINEKLESDLQDVQNATDVKDLDLKNQKSEAESKLKDQYESEIAAIEAIPEDKLPEEEGKTPEEVREELKQDAQDRLNEALSNLKDADSTDAVNEVVQNTTDEQTETLKDLFESVGIEVPESTEDGENLSLDDLAVLPVKTDAEEKLDEELEQKKAAIDSDEETYQDDEDLGTNTDAKSAEDKKNEAKAALDQEYEEYKEKVNNASSVEEIETELQKIKVEQELKNAAEEKIQEILKDDSIEPETNEAGETTKTVEEIKQEKIAEVQEELTKQKEQVEEQKNTSDLNQLVDKFDAVDQIQENLEKAKDAVDAMSDLTDDQKAELKAELEQDASDAKAAVESAKSQEEIQKQAEDNANSTKEKLKDAYISDLTTDSERKQDAIDNEIADVEEEIEKVDEKLEELNKKKEDLESAIEDAENENLKDELIKEKEKNDSQIAALEQEKKDLSNEKSSLEEEKAAVQEELEQKVQEASEIEDVKKLAFENEKSQALKDLTEKEETVLEEIQKMTQLTDEEKEQYIEQIKEEFENTKEAIKNAENSEGVQEAKATETESLEENLKNVTTSELQRQAEEDKKAVQENEELNSIEKEEKLEEIERELEEALEALEEGNNIEKAAEQKKADTEEKLNDAKTEAKEELESQAKAAEQALKNQAEEAKQNVDLLENIKDDKRQELKDAIDARLAEDLEKLASDLDDAKQSIDDAKTRQEVKQTLSDEQEEATNAISDTLKESNSDNTEDLADAVNGRKDIYQSEKDAIIEDLKKQSEEQDKATENATSALDLLKKQAESDVNKKTDDAIAAVESMVYLSEDEKQQQIEELEKQREEQLKAIDDAEDTEAVQTAKTESDEKVTETLKDAVQDNLENAAGKEIDRVNENEDLTDEEKQTEITRIKEELEEAKNQAATSDSDAKNLIRDIEKQNASDEETEQQYADDGSEEKVANAKTAAEEELEQKAKDAKDAIDSMSGLSEAEKEDYKNKVDEETEKAKESLNGKQSVSQIETEKSKGDDSTYETLKDALEKNLETKAQQQKEEVNNTTYSEDPEEDERIKEDLINEIDNKLEEQKRALEEAEDVVDLTLENLRNEKEEEIEKQREVAKEAIDALEDLTEEEKELEKSKIDEVADEKLAEINDAIDQAKEQKNDSENPQTPNISDLTDTLNDSVQDVKDKVSEAVQDENLIDETLQKKEEEKEQRLEEAKNQAKDEIQKTADAAKAAIDASDLPESEKEEKKSEIDQKAEEAKEAVEKENSVTQVEETTREKQQETFDDLKEALQDVIDEEDLSEAESPLDITKSLIEEKIEKQAEEAKDAIDAMTDLSDAEKEKMKQDIDDGVEAAKEQLQAAENASDVQDIEKDASDSVNDQLKEATQNNIETIADKKIDEINGDDSLSDQEKQEKIQEIEDKRQEDIQKVADSESKEDLALQNAKEEAKRDIEEKASDAKKAIDALSTLTDEEKQQKKDAIDAQVKEDLQKIDDAESTEDIDKAKDSSDKKTFNKMKDAVIEENNNEAEEEIQRIREDESLNEEQKAAEIERIQEETKEKNQEISKSTSFDELAVELVKEATQDDLGDVTEELQQKINDASTVSELETVLAKEEAKEKLTQEADEKITAIQENEKLTDEEKEEQIAAVQSELEKNLKNVDDAKSAAEVKTELNKIETKEQLEKQAEEAKTAIDQLKNLTEEEKQNAKDAIDSATEKALEDVDNAKSSNSISNTVQVVEDSVSEQTDTATDKNTSIQDELDRAAELRRQQEEAARKSTDTNRQNEETSISTEEETVVTVGPGVALQTTDILTENRDTETQAERQSTDETEEPTVISQPTTLEQEIQAVNVARAESNDDVVAEDTVIAIGKDEVTYAELVEQVENIEIQSGSILDRMNLTTTEIAGYMNNETIIDTALQQAKEEGYIDVEIKVSVTSLTKAVSDEDHIAKTVMTPEDLVRVLAGDHLEIRLDVDDTKEASHQSELEKAMREDDVLGMGMSIDLQKIFNGTEVTTVTELSDTFTFVLEIPEDMRGENRSYSILLYHENADGSHQVIRLDDMDSDEITITCETDRLCEAILVYTIGDTTADGTVDAGNDIGGYNYRFWLLIIFLIAIVIMALQFNRIRKERT